MLIVAGYAFTTALTDDLSATHLAQFAASCLITGFARTDFATAAHIEQISATTPVSDQGEGSLWFDTTLGLFRVKDSARWDCPYIGPELSNGTGSTIKQGSLVVCPSSGAMAPCQTLLWPEHLGWTVADVLNGAKGIVKSSGLVQALVRGPVRFGDILSADGALAGYVSAGLTLSIGYTCVTYGIDVGLCLGTLNTGLTALMTCIAWL